MLQTSRTYNYRRVIRRQMFLERGGRCEVCGDTAHHVHETINRGRTIRDSESRFLSYRKELCTILCPSCHDKAHNPEMQTALLRKNCERYGWNEVKAAFDEIETLSGNLNIEFPESDDNGKKNKT